MTVSHFRLLNQELNKNIGEIMPSSRIRSNLTTLKVIPSELLKGEGGALNFTGYQSERKTFYP